MTIDKPDVKVTNECSRFRAEDNNYCLTRKIELQLSRDLFFTMEPVSTASILANNWHHSYRTKRCSIKFSSPLMLLVKSGLNTRNRNDIGDGVFHCRLHNAFLRNLRGEGTTVFQLIRITW